MPRTPSENSPNPPCPVCGGNTSLNRILPSGNAQFRCNDRQNCGKTFTPRRKKPPGRPPKGDKAMTNAERCRKWRETHNKTGNESRDAKKNKSEKPIDDTENV